MAFLSKFQQFKKNIKKKFKIINKNTFFLNKNAPEGVQPSRSLKFLKKRVSPPPQPNQSAFQHFDPSNSSVQGQNRIGTAILA